MASIIRIKRSSVSGNPGTLGAGELAYSNLTDNGSNGGDRLYIGMGNETLGNAANHIVIGGKYFTDKLDHTPGVLTATSALITDADKKLDELLVDNLSLNGSTLSSTDTNGNILITPNGTGKTVITNAYIGDSSTSLLEYIQDATGGALTEGLGIDLAYDDGTGTTTITAELASSSNAGVASFNSTDFSVTGTGENQVTINEERIQDIVGAMVSSNSESGIAVTYDDTNGKLDFNVADPVITISGDVDGSATMTNLGDTTISVTLDTVNSNTGSFGSTTAIPVITVNGKGLITAVSTASITTTLGIASDAGTDSIALATDTLTVAGGEGIDTSINPTTNTITIAAELATSSNAGVATFNTNGFVVTGGDVVLKGDVVQSVTTDSGSMTPTSNNFSIVGGEGIDVTHSGTTISVAGEDATTTNKGVASFATENFSVTQGAVSTKNITLGTSTLTNGSTTSTLAGLQSLDVDNININGNTISSTDTNGNIVLSPNGTGSVDVSESKIIGVASPVSGTDAANKAYVDSAVTGLDWKNAVNLLAKTDIDLTGSSGTLVIDGHSALDTDHIGYRLLLTGQTTDTENGIYVYADTGTAYTLTRADDADTYQELVGSSVYVMEGTLYAGTGWVQGNHYLSSFAGQVWTQFAGSGAYVAGNGLTLTGTTFDVVGTSNRIDSNANSIDISANYVGQASITTLGTITTGTWHGDVIGATYGGTGVNNGSYTITLGGSVSTAGAFTTVGAYTIELTATAGTAVTLPTTGTLATLAGTETLTNKTINNSSIGSSNPGTAAFTTLTANNAVTFTGTTDSTSTTSGILQVAGGVGIAKSVVVGANITGAGAATSTLDGFNIDGGTY